MPESSEKFDSKLGHHIYFDFIKSDSKKILIWNLLGLEHKWRFRAEFCRPNRSGSYVSIAAYARTQSHT